MNIYKKILFLSLIFFVNKFAYSQTTYSNLNVGDRVNMIKNTSGSTNHSYHIYLFSDVNSCSLCMSSIQEIYQELSALYNIEVILFIGGISSNNISQLKNQYPSSWKIISDEIFAYKSLFKVNQYPFYYLLDKKGTIIAMDKGGGELDKKSILDLLNKRKNNNSNELNDENFDVIELEYNEAFLYANVRYIFYSPKNENIYLFIPGTKVLLIYSIEGKLLETHKLPLKNSIAFYDPNWFDEPYSFIIVHNSHENYREYMVYDTQERKITKVAVKPDSLLPTDDECLHYHTYYSNKLNVLFTTRYTLSNRILEDNFKPLIGINTKSSNVFSFGLVPDYYLKYQGSQFLYSTFLYDEHNDFLITNINNDENIYFWNVKDYSFIKKFSLNIRDNTIDIFKHDLIKGDDYKAKIEMFSKVNYCQNLYQLSSKKYALTLYKLLFKSDNINDYDFIYKIIIFDYQGEILKNIDLNKGVIPFFINENHALCSKYDGNDISIIKINMK